MRHHNVNRKFGRETNQRAALIKSLACNLIKHEKMITTEAKAKEIRPVVEKIVTKAKDDTVASRRIVNQKLVSPKIVAKLFKEIAPKYKDRRGGYLRIVKLGQRGGDGSKMAIVEFV